jgi:hypothetical protein
MFLTDCDVHVTPTDKFEFGVFNDSLCEWTRLTVATAHTQSRQLGDITRYGDTFENLTPLPLERIGIETCDDDFLIRI